MAETKCGFNSTPGGSNGSQLLTAYGPTILVDIGFDPAFNSSVPGFVPVPGIQGVSALIDTGARESCIDSLLASRLKLPIIDRRTVSGSAGRHEVNVHLGQVHVPSLGITVNGAFAGVHLEAGSQVHKALIGRSFLRICKMVYDGRTGDVTLSI